MQLRKNTQKEKKGSESRCILGGILHGEKRCLFSKSRGGKSNILHLKPLLLPFIIDLLVFFINGTSEWRDRTRAYENTEVYYWAYRQIKARIPTSKQSCHSTHHFLAGRVRKQILCEPLVHVLNWAPSWKCIRNNAYFCIQSVFQTLLQLLLHNHEWS